MLGKCIEELGIDALILADWLDEHGKDAGLVRICTEKSISYDFYMPHPPCCDIYGEDFVMHGNCDFGTIDGDGFSQCFENGDGISFHEIGYNYHVPFDDLVCIGIGFEDGGDEKGNGQSDWKDLLNVWQIY